GDEPLEARDGAVRVAEMGDRDLARLAERLDRARHGVAPSLGERLHLEAVGRARLGARLRAGGDRLEEVGELGVLRELAVEREERARRLGVERRVPERALVERD